MFEARNLIACDRNGLSDPFVEIRLGNQISKSKVIPKTLNPVFDFQTDLIITSVMLDASLSLLITLWDKDTIGRDFMGCITIRMLQESNISNNGFRFGSV